LPRIGTKLLKPLTTNKAKYKTMKHKIYTLTLIISLFSIRLNAASASLSASPSSGIIPCGFSSGLFLNFNTNYGSGFFYQGIQSITWYQNGTQISTGTSSSMSTSVPATYYAVVVMRFYWSGPGYTVYPSYTSNSITLSPPTAYNWFLDTDNDGYVTGTPIYTCSNLSGSGYRYQGILGTDCAPNDNTLYQSATLYIDADNDDYDNGTATVCYGASIPAGYKASTLGSDCNDADNTVWQTTQRYIDSDNDGFGTGSLVTVCYGNSIPAGYSTNNTDCAASDDTQWQSANLYIDADNDDYDNGTATLCYGASIPAGYKVSTLGSDCNDNDNLLTTSCGPKVWNGSLSTAWNTAGNWTPTGIPTATDDVVIPDLPNDPIIGFIPGSVKNIDMADGVEIRVNNGIALYVNGHLTAGSGSGCNIAGAGGILELNGSDPQQINGNLTVNVLRINNSSMGGVDVLGTLNIDTGFIMLDGDVNALSGNVTLKSNATATAYFDNFSSPTVGTYFGDMTVERYVGNASAGYRDISSPVNTTVADLADDMGIIGQDAVHCWYSYSPYPNVQYYNESSNAVTNNYYGGWWSMTGGGNALPALKGVAIRTGAGPYTIDLTGAPYTGNKATTVTHTPTGTPAADGWNFVGNAYPSPVDWNDIYTLNINDYGLDLDASYYAFNTTGEYTGNWSSWNGSTGTNGGTRNIAAMQGFFIKKTGPGSGDFGMENIVREANAFTAFHKTNAVMQDEIRLELRGNSNSDEIVAYTEGAASWGFDATHDAVKIPAGSTVYMSYKQLGKEYAINVIDEITETTELPLVIWAQDSGTYTFEATELNVDGYITYLKDAELNTLTDLTTTGSVTMQLNGGQTYEGRYSIVFEAVELMSQVHRQHQLTATSKSTATKT
jgi:hypothetical protein